MTEKKRLKAVHKKNKERKSFNFETKTLARAIPVFKGDSGATKNIKIRHNYHNRAMRREREKAI